MTSPPARHAALALGAMLLASRLPAQATGALAGRVVNDRTDQPVAGVEVSITAISRSVSTDSGGKFSLRDIAAGRHQVVLRKVGYQPFSTTLTTTGADGPEQLLRLAPASTELSKVYVVTTAIDRRLTTFEAHRSSGMGGSFLTSARLEKERGRALTDVLQGVSGADIVRGRGGAAFFATRRGYDSFMNMPNARLADRARGASSGLCYAAVVVNNVFVYRGGDEEEIFDVNSLAPTDILGVEVYKGGATMPLEYNATRKTCGLLVIFTK